MGKKIKCVVWDLDNTIWDGILIEDGIVTLKEGIEQVIKALDERGILQSVASKNEHHEAMLQLKAFGLDQYFIYPQISWNTKADSVKIIAESINIGIDTLAFIDDQVIEREEVRFSHPEVMVIDAENYKKLLDFEELTPRFITEDSKKRRLMYQSDIARKHEETTFQGPNEQFLESLNMQLVISKVKEDDLKRVEELTLRTNQLNSTGYTYSYEELLGFINSDEHIFIIAELKDRFGDYGKIGLGLMERKEDGYIIKLLLMSCRVMTKGIGTAMLVYFINLCKANHKKLYAEFLQTSRNRVMYITYKFMGFEEVEESEEEDDGEEEQIMFSYTSDTDRNFPPYLEVIIEA